MPFADQYVVGGSRRHLNRFMAHPPSAGVVETPMNESRLGDKLLLLNSGQCFNFDTQQKTPDEPFYCHTDTDRAAYIETLAHTHYDHERITLNPSVSIERLLQSARDRMWQAQTRMNQFPVFSLYLDTSDRHRRWRIAMNNPLIEEVSWDAPLLEPYLRISCHATLLAFLLIGHVSWNIADAALFLDYDRVPNTYQPDLYILLNFLKI
jgi:hypothetical protein